jgi:hypothetical protein
VDQVPQGISPKKPYQTPVLTVYGSVLVLTKTFKVGPGRIDTPLHRTSKT